MEPPLLGGATQHTRGVPRYTSLALFHVSNRSPATSTELSIRGKGVVVSSRRHDWLLGFSAQICSGWESGPSFQISNTASSPTHTPLAPTSSKTRGSPGNAGSSEIRSPLASTRRTGAPGTDDRLTNELTRPPAPG